MDKGATYDITVEQCEGGAPSTNPNPDSKGGSTTPKAETPTTPPKIPATPPKSSPPTPKTPSPSPDDGTLMNAGGPGDGPLPIMPSGECPPLAPVQRDGACYST